jgi:hypothetical protein
MIWPESLSIRSVVDVYVASNTPSYLFKRLRRNDIVHELAQSSAADLAELVQTLLAGKDRTESDVAGAYAALAAMTLRDYSEWQGLVGTLDLKPLDWGARFRELMIARAVPTLVAHLRPSPLAIPVYGSAETTSSSLTVTGQRPTLTVVL